MANPAPDKARHHTDMKTGMRSNHRNAEPQEIDQPTREGLTVVSPRIGAPSAGTPIAPDQAPWFPAPRNLPI